MPLDPITTEDLQLRLLRHDAKWQQYLCRFPATVACTCPELIEFDPRRNYAGPRGNKWVELAVPDTIYLVPIRYAAFIHDQAYQIGGTEPDRAAADELFYFLILNILENSYLTHPWTPKPLTNRALARATLYYQAVRILGSSSFNHTKEPHK